MQLRLPRFFRQFLVLVASLTLLTSVTSSGVRADEPVPLCLQYREWKGQAYTLRQVNPRNGQTYPAAWGYPTTFDNFPLSGQYSPNGRLFAHTERPQSLSPDTLFIGVVGNDKLRLIDQQYFISGGWSPDGKWFAYAYANQTAGIGVADANGIYTTLQQPLATFKRGHYLSFAGWSADSQYVAAVESPITTTDTLSTYYFMAMDKRRLIQTTIEAYSNPGIADTALVWSPQGHRFAYVEAAEERLTLVIGTPEGGTEQRFALPTGAYLRFPLVWSPDGRYVALRSTAKTNLLYNNGVGPSVDYWTYSVFGVDGTIRAGIRGPNATGSYVRLDDWWSSDSTTWYFRQQNYVRGMEEGTDAALSFVVGYRVATNTAYTIASRVAGSPVLLDDGQWLAVPVANDDRLDVGLFSIDGKQRTTLIAGAIRDKAPYLERSPDAKHSMIAARWSRATDTGQRIASLTWAHADGSQLHTVDQNFEEIHQLRWLESQHALLYIARRGTTFIVGVVDLETGLPLAQIEIQAQADPNKPPTSWDEYPQIAPSSREMILVRSGHGNRQDLYLVSLAGKQTKQITVEEPYLREFYWSPGATLVAFTRYDATNSHRTLWVIAADGMVVAQIDLTSEDRYVNAITLDGWAWCK